MQDAGEDEQQCAREKSRGVDGKERRSCNNYLRISRSHEDVPTVEHTRQVPRLTASNRVLLCTNAIVTTGMYANAGHYHDYSSDCSCFMPSLLYYLPRPTSSILRRSLHDDLNPGAKTLHHSPHHSRPCDPTSPCHLDSSASPPH